MFICRKKARFFLCWSTCIGFAFLFKKR